MANLDLRGPSQVHDRADTPGIQVGHLALSEREDGVAGEQMGPVLVHTGRARDDMLVHQRRPEGIRSHRPEGGLDGCHVPLLM